MLPFKQQQRYQKHPCLAIVYTTPEHIARQEESFNDLQHKWERNSSNISHNLALVFGASDYLVIIYGFDRLWMYNTLNLKGHQLKQEKITTSAFFFHQVRIQKNSNRRVRTENSGYRAGCGWGGRADQCACQPHVALQCIGVWMRVNVRQKAMRQVCYTRTSPFTFCTVLSKCRICMDRRIVLVLDVLFVFASSYCQICTDQSWPIKPGWHAGKQSHGLPKCNL